MVTTAKVAANVVSKALIQSAGPHPSTTSHEDHSEESEDSDDSTTDLKQPEVIDEPTPPPRRKKDLKKSINKPPVVARTKKDFTQLHQEFAPSEVRAYTLIQLHSSMIWCDIYVVAALYTAPYASVLYSSVV